MHICLITDNYPALAHSGAGTRYITELASGLSCEGYDVTVICWENSTGENGTGENSTGETGVKVMRAFDGMSSESLLLAPSVMPSSVAYAFRQLGYWKALAELHDKKKIDVAETVRSSAGALLQAITREIPTVVHMDIVPAERAEPEFDRSFGQLIDNFVLACADACSGATSETSGTPSDRICSNDEVGAVCLARRQVEIYQIACHKFSQATRPHFYRHGARRLIKSTEDMILLYDKMLYDLLFRVSYRFRIGHWFRALRSDPRGFIEKIKSRFS